MEQTAEKKKMDEITIKFGKGCVGEPFTGKDGKEYKQILIPNKDENDQMQCMRISMVRVCG